MATLKDTKRRIVSVKNTQKITRAMKLVASAKYARASQSVFKSEPYMTAFGSHLSSLLNQGGALSSPLLEQRAVKRVLVVVIAADRGLCGGLNSNLLKKAKLCVKEMAQPGVELSVALWGKRAEGLGGEVGCSVFEKRDHVFEKPDYTFAATQAERLREKFLKKEFDQIVCIYNRFESVLSQVPTQETLLPVLLEKEQNAGDDDARGDYLVEPNESALLEGVLARRLASRIFSMLLTSNASEHAARMTAMDSATNNADEVVRKLTLEYNRGRQAAITTELIEITSGAEAL